MEGAVGFPQETQETVRWAEWSEQRINHAVYSHVSRDKSVHIDVFEDIDDWNSAKNCCFQDMGARALDVDSLVGYVFDTLKLAAVDFPRSEYIP
jgi:hypothetical protein